MFLGKKSFTCFHGWKNKIRKMIMEKKNHPKKTLSSQSFHTEQLYSYTYITKWPPRVCSVYKYITYQICKVLEKLENSPCLKMLKKCLNLTYKSQIKDTSYNSRTCLRILTFYSLLQFVYLLISGLFDRDRYSVHGQV